MASVFVTGATGYIGAVVCEKLREAGHSVSGLARSDAAAHKLEAAGVAVVRGDVRDAAVLSAACQAADGVIHTAAAWGPEFGAIDRAAVECMLAALAGSDKPFVYSSGTWVMGNTEGRLAGEAFRLRPPAFLTWRPEVERLVMDAGERKVCGVVIRPATVYGRGMGRPEKMARGEAPVVGDGSNHWSFVHVDDLADLYVRAIEHASAGSLYLAADGPAVQLKKFVELFGAKQISLDEASQTIGPVAGAMVLDQRIGSTRAGRELGWRPRRPTVLEELRKS